MKNIYRLKQWPLHSVVVDTTTGDFAVKHASFEDATAYGNLAKDYGCTFEIEASYVREEEKEYADAFHVLRIGCEKDIIGVNAKYHFPKEITRRIEKELIKTGAFKLEKVIK